MESIYLKVITSDEISIFADNYLGYKNSRLFAENKPLFF